MFKNLSKLKKEVNDKLITQLFNEIEIGVNKKIEQRNNQPSIPHNKEYHEKLYDLVQKEVEQKDQFINWITGIAAAVMILIFTEIPDLADKILIQSAHVLGYLIYVGVTFMSILIIAIIFKISSGVRYWDLKLDVEMMEMELIGANFMAEIRKKMSNFESIDDKSYLQFLKHFKRMLESTSPSNLRKIKIWSNIASWTIEISYYSSLILFLGAMIFTVYIFLYLIPPTLKLTSH